MHDTDYKASLGRPLGQFVSAEIFYVASDSCSGFKFVLRGKLDKNMFGRFADVAASQKNCTAVRDMKHIKGADGVVTTFELIMRTGITKPHAYIGAYRFRDAAVATMKEYDGAANEKETDRLLTQSWATR